MDSQVEITETYEEAYPSGKRNFEMIKFVLTEREQVYIPASAALDETKTSDIVMEARRWMHTRLTSAVKLMVEKAVKEGKLVGLK